MESAGNILPEQAARFLNEYFWDPFAELYIGGLAHPRFEESMAVLHREAPELDFTAHTKRFVNTCLGDVATRAANHMLHLPHLRVLEEVKPLYLNPRDPVLRLNDTERAMHESADILWHKLRRNSLHLAFPELYIVLLSVEKAIPKLTGLQGAAAMGALLRSRNIVNKLARLHDPVEENTLYKDLLNNAGEISYRTPTLEEVLADHEQGGTRYTIPEQRFTVKHDTAGQPYLDITDLPAAGLVGCPFIHASTKTKEGGRELMLTTVWRIVVTEHARARGLSLPSPVQPQSDRRPSRHG